MAKLGTTEIFIIVLVLIGIPLLFYSLGKKSGYKQGQLDMYKKMEEENKKKA
jgi:F0F1-type ATP synthase assembly protein I